MKLYHESGNLWIASGNDRSVMAEFDCLDHRSLMSLSGTPCSLAKATAYVSSGAVSPHYEPRLAVRVSGSVGNSRQWNRAGFWRVVTHCKRRRPGCARLFLTALCARRGRETFKIASRDLPQTLASGWFGVVGYLFLCLDTVKTRFAFVHARQSDAHSAKRSLPRRWPSLIRTD